MRTEPEQPGFEHLTALFGSRLTTEIKVNALDIVL
jgi:hypothetical protein